jgi:metal-responsive CopG/Arc/MetJ family transcriptional regulator
MQRCTGVSLGSDIVEELDRRRGLIPRSALINEILRKELGLKTKLNGDTKK